MSSENMIMMIFNMSPEAIFSQNFTSLFCGLFNDETDLRVPRLGNLRSPWDVLGIEGWQP
jgi:hypothetical protein